MKRIPFVSVIIPCFNYGHLLAEALESVRAQSLLEWECIVVDDGSTDTTAAIAREYAARDERIACLSQENRGLSAARNAGLRAATAKYAQLLDADDLLEPEKLAVHVRFLEEHEGYALVYGPMRYFRTQGASRLYASGRDGSGRAWMKMWQDTTDEMLAAFVEGNQFPVSAAVFRRSMLDEVGYFDETLRSHEDWDLWLRCVLAAKRFHGLEARGTKTLIREHAGTLTKGAVTMAETRLQVRDRIGELATTEALLATNREWRSYDECELGAAHLAAGHWRVGVRSYLSGFANAKNKVKALRALAAHLAPGWLLALWRWMRWGAPAREAA